MLTSWFSMVVYILWIDFDINQWWSIFTYLSWLLFFIAGYKCNRISVRQCQISLLTCKFFVMVVYYLSIDLLRIFSLINQQDKLTSTQKKYTRYILLTVVGGSPQVSFLKSKVIKRFNLVIKIRLVRWCHFEKYAVVFWQNLTLLR